MLTEEIKTINRLSSQLYFSVSIQLIRETIKEDYWQKENTNAVCTIQCIATNGISQHVHAIQTSPLKYRNSKKHTAGDPVHYSLWGTLRLIQLQLLFFFLFSFWPCSVQENLLYVLFTMTQGGILFTMTQGGGTPQKENVLKCGWNAIVVLDPTV